MLLFRCLTLPLPSQEHIIESLGGRGQFNVLHLRAESDWLRHTSAGDDVAPPVDATLGEEPLLWLHTRAAEEVQGAINSIIAAHSSGDGQLDETLMAMPLFIASGVACDHPIYAPLRLLMGVEIQCLPESDGADGSYRKAAVEQAVAEAALVFIGRTGSSFSWTVATRRALRSSTGDTSSTNTDTHTVQVPSSSTHRPFVTAWYRADPPTPRDMGDMGGFAAWERQWGFPSLDGPI
jgi:hypothetical protein